MADEDVLEIYGKSIYDLRVADLKKELDKRALSKIGNKKELVDRLKAHHLKEATSREDQQMLLEKYRAQASGDGVDVDEATANISLPGDATQNDLVNQYLAKKKQLQEQPEGKEEQSKSAKESEHESNDEATSPTKEGPNNHSPHRGKREVRLTRGGLVKLKPASDAANNDANGPPPPEDAPLEHGTSCQRSTSGEQSPSAERMPASPARRDSNEEEEMDVQPPGHPGSWSPSCKASPKTESLPRKRSWSQSNSPEHKPRRTTRTSSPGEESPRSEIPSPFISKSRSPSPKLKTPIPEKVKAKSRSSSPETTRKPSSTKESSWSRSSDKGKANSRSHSPGQKKSRSLTLEKRSASSSSDKSDNEITFKKHSKSKEGSSNERGRGPVRSRRPPSSSSSGSRSESSSSSGSSRSRSRSHSRSRSRSSSPQKKRGRRVPRSASRSRSKSPDTSSKKTFKKEDSQKNGDDASTAKWKEEPMDKITAREPAQEPKDIKPDVNGSSCEPKAIERFPVVRRRRWGSTRTSTTKAAIVVSTESLKGLIPEIKPSALNQEPVLELAPPEEEEEKMDQEEAEEDVFKKDLKIQRTVTQEVNSSAVQLKEDPPVAPPPAPTPEKDDVRQVEVGEIPEPTPVPAKEESKESRKATHKPRRTMDVSVAPDEPQPSRRSPSPARNPVSCIIHIRNLVRPYTLGQLKEVLGRTGTLVDNGFWIDTIKSHAYATYESEDQAKASRQALHGTRWPSSNPKLLRIEYATQDEVDYHKSGDVTPASIKRQVRQDITAKPPAPPADDPLRGIAPEGRNRKEDPRNSRPDAVREWDRDKVRQSRSRSHERRESDRRRAEDRSRDKSREQEKKKRDRSKERKERKEKKEETEEAPAKLLDDLFCKTKATPCIYWLPLTEEQALIRAQRIRSQEEERERRRKEMLKKDDDMRRLREKDREDRMRHRDGPPRRSQDRGRPGDRAPDKNRNNRGRRSRSRSRGLGGGRRR